MRLIEALQDGRDCRRGGTENLRRRRRITVCHPADLGNSGRRVVAGHGNQCLEASGVRFDVVLVDPAVGDQLLQQTVDQREVGTGPRRQMDLGRLDDRRLSWIDCDQA